VLSVSWLEARPGYILPVNRLSEPNTLLHEVVCPLLSAAAWDPQVACAKVTGTVVRTMAAAEAAPHFGAELKDAFKPVNNWVRSSMLFPRMYDAYGKIQQTRCSTLAPVLNTISRFPMVLLGWRRYNSSIENGA
jgi:hypothetical protein